MNIKNIVNAIEELSIEDITKDAFIKNTLYQKGELSKSDVRYLSNKIGKFREIQSVTLKKFSVPDIALYKKAAASYEEYAKALSDAAAKNAQKEAEESSRFKATMQKMESLGETLKKYPELSDMIKNSDNINKTLQTIDSIE